MLNNLKTLPQLFSEQVARNPHQKAVTFKQQYLTYQELNTRANRLANYLVQHTAIHSDTLIPVVIDRSINTLVTLLAILKAGAAYVPIDPSFPLERIRLVLEDCQPEFVITESSYLRLLQSLDLPIKYLPLDLQNDAIAKASSLELNQNIALQDLAYVIYTSGSTGNPKGVMIEHRNLASFLIAINKHLRVTTHDNLLAISAYTFDISGLDFYLPLVNGAHCIIADSQTAADLNAIWQLLQEHDISVLQATPAMWNLLVSNNKLFNPALKVICGGEALSTMLANKLLAHFDKVWNVYGPTETTIWSTIHALTQLDLDKTIPIGKPLANTTVQILNANLEPLPPGEIGEICIGGLSVARGYLNRPALTTQKFVHTKDKLYLYKTGDLGCITPEQTILFLGRNDDQIKIRGFRIEPAEIEKQLNAYPHIKQSVVIATTRDDDQVLIAYLCVHANITLDIVLLHEFLERDLPNYMLPNAFVLIDHIPLTLHGKIDKKELTRNQNYLLPKSVPTAPRTPQEKLIQQIWATILNIDIDSIGINDNFFHLGGHSLLAAQVLFRLQESFQRHFTLADFFAQPTIAELATFLSQLSIISFKRPPLKPRSVTEAPLLSFAQERLWFLDKLQPLNTFYNLPIALQIDGPFDREAFQHAFIALLNRHEILRTCFNQDDEQLVQTITSAENLKLNFSITQLNNLCTTSIKQLISQEAQLPFNLQEAPLLRLKLWQHHTTHLLVITFHHSITDGWSMGILARELSALYHAQLSGTEVPLKPLAIQYADYAVWQRKWLQGEILDQQLLYWKHHLKDAPTLALPLDFPRPASQTFHGATLAVKIDNNVYKQIKKLNKETNVTLFTTLISIFAFVFSRYTGQEDILIGTPIAGRVTPTLETLIGFFINTLCLRTQIMPQQDFLTLLATTQQILLNAYDHQDAPFEKVVEVSGCERDLSRHPLFQVMFVLQNTPSHPWDFPHTQITPHPAQVNSSKFDLTLVLNETNEAIDGHIEYNTALFQPETIARFWQHYLILLTHCLAQPTQAIKNFCMLTEDEKQALLIDFNAERKNYPRDKTLAQLFEAQVEKNPQKIALELGEIHLTYAMLNQKANQLAHYLRDRYLITPNKLIPILVDRSLEMGISVLAVLKAGAAYVPIDPSYPTERINYMFADLAATLVITKTPYLAQCQALTDCLLLDEVLEQLDQASQLNLNLETSSNDLAYVIYTSGSTGKPKGVLVPHKGVINTIYAQIDFFQIYPSSRILQFASFGFDSNVSETFRTLLSGATLILNPPEKLTPGEVLANTIDQQQISVITLPPAALNLMPIKPYPTLKTLITAGEACSAELMNQWANQYHCVNAYGPTETSICATLAKCEEGIQKPPIGKPIANVEVFVLDAYLQPVPVNVTGELYIGGSGLSYGYLNQPELTLERFIQHPFNTSPDARLYKTGDLVRFRNGQQLEFLGRNDDQVKIRGFRIELGDIEKHLQSHPDVSQCVVLAKTINQDNRLIAYVTPNSNQQLEITSLRNHLTQLLPSHMIPNAFVILDKFPLTTNRKVDKKALLAFDKYETTVIDYVPPRNKVEIALVKIWQELLQLNPIGVHDHFFNLGGHSLLVVTLVMRLKKIFGKTYPIALIFENPTIASLATFIQDDTQLAALNPIVPIHEKGNKAPLYFVHETMGTTFTYASLQKYLSPDQPFYGIQDPTMGKTEKFPTLEAMATCYKNAIRKVQANGPYYLGGWCLGGIIAYEIAQQLVAEGQTVANVILIDSPMNISMQRPTDVFSDDYVRINKWLRENETTQPVLGTDDLDNWFEQLTHEIVHRIKLMRQYTVKNYAHKVTLIKAQESLHADDKLTPSYDNGWDGCVKELKIYPASGNHLTMIKEPHVQGLAGMIQAVL